MTDSEMIQADCLLYDLIKSFKIVDNVTAGALAEKLAKHNVVVDRWCKTSELCPPINVPVVAWIEKYKEYRILEFDFKRYERKKNESPYCWHDGVEAFDEYDIEYWRPIPDIPKERDGK